MLNDSLDLFELLLRLAAAYGLAFLVGFERGHAARRAGFRTFPLVALGACGYLVLGEHLISESEDAHARLIQGLMTGIGFVGGGVILKTEGGVQGLATAASLWGTGAIGAACAHAQWPLAVILALANLATLHLFHTRSGGASSPE